VIDLILQQGFERGTGCWLDRSGNHLGEAHTRDRLTQAAHLDDVEEHSLRGKREGAAVPSSRRRQGE
jgi:hypothetical protein